MVKMRAEVKEKNVFVCARVVTNNPEQKSICLSTIE